MVKRENSSTLCIHPWCRERLSFASERPRVEFQQLHLDFGPITEAFFVIREVKITMMVMMGVVLVLVMGAVLVLVMMGVVLLLVLVLVMTMMTPVFRG